MNCVNCGIATIRNNSIGGWTAPKIINNKHHVCSACWTLAHEQQGASTSSTTTIGHCGLFTVTKARDMLYECFVPQYLGYNHINRQQIVEKTLIILKGLFGNFEGEERPVAIFDDGHIIDVLGPYPVITSDAEIIKSEIQKENSELKDYFQPGDAFVLDRGFRDVLPLLNTCSFRTFVPVTLQEGESQMSTLEANKSRAVTICWWVVEIVNDRFKRDYKLFRQDYFKRASKHLMKDFEVATALLTRLHLPITNRTDAREILCINNEKMFTNNTLADFVQKNTLYKRRANYTN